VTFELIEVLALLSDLLLEGSKPNSDVSSCSWLGGAKINSLLQFLLTDVKALLGSLPAGECVTGRTRS
jgi:hypothetical protein